jgi:hypothetical protein
MKLYHVYIDRKPDGTPFYVGIGNDARVKCVQRNNWHRAIRLRYPNWTREVIETAPRKLCMELEEFLISEIGRRNMGRGPLVNFTDGGEGAPATIVSDETRRKQSLSRRGKKKSDEWRTNISKSHKGKKKSVETCAKISASKRGAKMSDSHRICTSNAVRKRWENPEYASKMSQMSLEKWENDDRRKDASIRMSERMADPEILTAMRDAVVKTWQSPELREQASLRIKGKKWINKDGVSMRVAVSELEERFLSGWKKGRK